MTQALDEVLQAVDAGLEDSLESLTELLRFPSVGTDPAHNADCQRAADWLKAYFEGMGLAARIHPTTGQPVVVATYEPPRNAVNAKTHVPHILFYGHYDVQPADPLDLWDSPPFEPRRGEAKSGRSCIYARGAADDKGQLMTFTEASRHWLARHGSLPFRLTILIEGDEEGDGSHLDRFVAKNRAMLAADVAVICDTDMWDTDIPSITTSLRGCIGDEVTITGPSKDLHSGYYGGPAHNPLKVLSGILGRMFDAKGRITIPGLYDGVKTHSPKARAALAKVPFNTRKYMATAGLKTPAGEHGFSALEQQWFRPTAEINGMWGGYTGPGGKTVIPSKATAKLTFRLVEGQKPQKVRKAFRDFVKKQLPAGCKASFESSGGDAAGISVNTSSRWITAGIRALTAEWGVKPVLGGSGGSIPVVESFKKHLNIDSVLIGFVREDDALHSPNEKYDIDAFHRGIRSYARFIAELAN